MKISVLIVDDDKDIAESISDILRMKGIHVLGIAYDGQQAVELYANLKPDVVLMDIMMPKYDGFYGIEKIREYNPKSKIMIISASLTPLYVKRLLELNVDCISLKPYDLSNVIETMHKINEGTEVQKVPNIFQRQLNQ